MKGALTLAAMLVATIAHPNLVVNGSFENGNFLPNGQNTMSLAVGATEMTGWTVITDALAWIADPNPFSGLHASNGTKSLDLTGYSDSAPHGGVTQVIPTVPGALYRVTFDLGTHSAFTTLAAVTVSAAGQQQTFTQTSTSGQRWVSCAWTFTANSTATTLSLLGTQSSNAYIGLDHVVVERIARIGPPTPKPQGTQVELLLTRADGTSERYMTFQPPPAGRRNPPISLVFGEQVTITGRLVDTQGNGPYPGTVVHSLSNSVCSYNPANGRLSSNRLGSTSLTSSGALPGQPVIQSSIHVYPPAVVAFSDWDDIAFGTGAIKTYLYVPGARVNSPRGDKIWEVPYRDDAYLGRALAEPGVLLPTGFVTGYDVVQPAINSRANRIAMVVAPFDTVSGNVTYYKDVVVMDVGYDANGAPIFGTTRPQNVPYDTTDQMTPQWGPQADANLDGILYFSSMEFDRNTGDYLPGMERDIFERTNINAASSPGVNLTSGVSGNLLWPTVAPDNIEMAVIRKVGVGTGAASPSGVGRIMTIRMLPFAPSAEQIDTTASAASRIAYVASHGIQIPGSSNPATLVNPDKYFVAFARSFDGGFTTQVELIRAERTQAALGAFITQQLNASNSFCAAIDGTTGAEFTVRNPRRVMCFLYNNIELRVKNVTSPAAGGIGSLITTLDIGMSGRIAGGPVWPAPFDAFPPLSR